MEDSPWSEWRRGNSVRARSIAKFLKPYGINPKRKKSTDAIKSQVFKTPLHGISTPPPLNRHQELPFGMPVKSFDYSAAGWVTLGEEVTDKALPNLKSVTPSITCFLNFYIDLRKSNALLKVSAQIFPKLLSAARRNNSAILSLSRAVCPGFGLVPRGLVCVQKFLLCKHDASPSPSKLLCLFEPK